MEETFIDETGKAKVIRKIVKKDQYGREYEVTETINADGSKNVVTEKIGKDGQRVWVSEITDKLLDLEVENVRLYELAKKKGFKDT